MIRSYADAAATFATARNKDAGKPLASSTRLHKRGENYAVQYHDTYVVIFRPNGEIRLDTGGWLTMSTRARIEECLPAGWGLTSDKGRWFLVQRGDTWNAPKARYAFRDGITLHPDGTVTGHEPDAVVAEQDKENKALNKALKTYVEALTPEVLQAALTNAGGDCFGCLAPAAFDVSHLALHLAEGYYPARMIVSAVESRGYKPDVYLSAAVRQGDWYLRTVQTCVRDYMRNALYAGAVSVRHGRRPVGASKVTWQASA